MNPALLEPYGKAEKIREQKEDTRRWMMGCYVFEALSVALSNVFRKRGQKARQFRDKPYMTEVTETKKELGKKEIVEKTETLFKMLQIRQANYELEQKYKNGSANNS